MHRTLILLLLFIFPIFVHAQDDAWDVYMAQYEKGAGSTVINMSLRQIAPVKTLPFILVTGVKFKNCQEDGFPSKEEFTRLYRISDSVKAKTEQLVKNRFAGTFTYQCERLDYYYIADTIAIREKLAALYAKEFSSYEPYINIKSDESWQAYLEFLYPNEQTYEYMSNQKVVMRLQESGDKLDKERQVDHWLYFTTEQGRNCFITYATQNKFQIVSKEKTKEGNRRYQLQIKRTDKVDINSITKITLELKKQAEKCDGNYDGWETFTIKP